MEAVRAIYNYEARREDELSFKKGDIIHNVKTMPGMKSLANTYESWPLSSLSISMIEA